MASWLAAALPRHSSSEFVNDGRDLALDTRVKTPFACAFSPIALGLFGSNSIGCMLDCMMNIVTTMQGTSMAADLDSLVDGETFAG